MLVYGSFSPFSIYTSVHELIRLAFPGCKILTSEPMGGDDNRITISLTEQGNKVGLYGRVEIGVNSTVLNQEWELNGSQARNNEVKKLTRRFTYLLLAKHLKRRLSNYGILTGVRPVKLVHRLWDQGYSEPEIIEIMKKDYLISQEKAELLMEIAGNNRPYLLTPEKARKCVSIYIGIPFCLSRCYYCSFPGAVLNDYDQQISPFVETLVKEMTVVGDYINHHGFNVQTIYLGEEPLQYLAKRIWL
jgi:oxygen-independent coproporphyrinogen-3 oxidase